MGSQKMLQPANAAGRKQKAQRTPKRAGAAKKTHLYRQDPAGHVGQQTDGIDTPCRQMAQLELKPKTKQPKLLGSKSLSQLIPRKLLFRTSSAVAPTQAKNDTSASRPREATLNPFPNEAFANDQMEAMGPINHIQSASMLCLPGRSSSSGQLSDFRFPLEDCTLGQPNFSPIVSKTSELVLDAGDVCFSSTRANVESDGSPFAQDQSAPKTDRNSQNDADKKGAEPKMTEAKFKPLKNTTMVLRDVKNSIGLRIRARKESKAFTKLTNELATPPTKLYSPFNITDSCASKHSRVTRRCAGSPGDNNTSLVSADSGLEVSMTPKQRIALQHKKHLMQANRFTNFISPSGKLRETVKDVEHFQQCIEDISRAIKAREESK